MVGPGLETLVSRVGAVLVANYDCPSVGEGGGGDLQEGFQADVQKISNALAALAATEEVPNRIETLENTTVAAMREEIRKGREIAHEEGTAEDGSGSGIGRAIFFAVVEAPGCLLGSVVHVQGGCGEWVSVETLAQDCAPDSPADVSVLVVHALSTQAIGGQQQGELREFEPPQGVVVLWGHVPRHEYFCDKGGTVLGQLVGQHLDAQAEAMTVVDLLQRAVDIFRWYVKGKRKSIDKTILKPRPLASLVCAKGTPSCRFSLGRVAQPCYHPTGNTLKDNEGFLIRAKQWQYFSVHTLDCKVSIHSFTPGAEIFYTTDGSDPVPWAIGSATPSSTSANISRPTSSVAFLSPSKLSVPGSFNGSETPPQYGSEHELADSPHHGPFEQSSSAAPFLPPLMHREGAAYCLLGAPNPGGACEATRRYRKPIALSYRGDGFKEFSVRAIAVVPGLRPSKIGVSTVYRIQGQVDSVKFKELRTDDAVMLTMSCKTPGATIHYDSTGAYPTTFSPIYTEPIRLHAKLLRAVAVAPGQTDSPVSTFELLDQVIAPEVRAFGREVPSSSLGDRRLVFLDELTVEASSASSRKAKNIKIFYTTDGSEPTHKSTRFLQPIVISEAGVHQFSFQAFGDMMADSEIVEASFTVQNNALAPEISLTPSGEFSETEAPGPDVYRERATLSFSCETPDVAIYYTVDGSPPDPQGAGILYKGPILLNRRDPKAFAEGGILKSFDGSGGKPIHVQPRVCAVRMDMVDSEEATAKFSLLEVVKTPRSDPEGGLFREFTDVTMTCQTLGAEILYVIGPGEPPSKGGQGTLTYTGPVRIDDVGWTDVHVRAVREGMWDSDVWHAKYGVEAQVFSWGTNLYGRLGTGDDEVREKPDRVRGLLDNTIVKVYAGSSHTVLIDADGKVLTAGSGMHGKLGHGVYTDECLPRLVWTGLEGIRITQAALGERHTMLLTDSGLIYTFGDGSFGQLGHGEFESLLKPTMIKELQPGKRPVNGKMALFPPVTHIVAGGFHSVCIVKGGVVHSWGRGGEGQLGTETRFSEPTPKKMLARLNDDDEEEGLYGQKVLACAASTWHTVLICMSGIVFTCGRGLEGQLGRVNTPYMLVPARVFELSKRRILGVKCAAGREHTMIVDKVGSVWAFGSGANGRMGTGDTTSSYVPRKIEALEQHDVVDLLAGADTCAAVTRGGSLLVWGMGQGWSMGNQSQEDVMRPTEVPALKGFHVGQAAVGHRHMVALMNSTSSGVKRSAPVISANVTMDFSEGLPTRNASMDSDCFPTESAVGDQAVAPAQSRAEMIADLLPRMSLAPADTNSIPWTSFRTDSLKLGSGASAGGVRTLLKSHSKMDVSGRTTAQAPEGGFPSRARHDSKGSGPGSVGSSGSVSRTSSVPEGSVGSEAFGSALFDD